MRKRIFRGALALTLSTALLMGVLASLASYQMAEEQLVSRLWQELDLVGSLKKEAGGNEAFRATLGGLAIPDRLTWIAPDGGVWYDNQSRADSMGNHLDREEIVQAAQTGAGTAKRYSDTLLEEQVYCARALLDGSFLRVAATQRSVGGYIARLIWVIAAGALAVSALMAALSRGWTARLVKPINEADLENPLANRVYDELTPMLRRLEEQKRSLNARVRELADRRGELDAILKQMREGLLILDAHGHVLMMNDSAREILHTERAVDGKTALAVYHRSQALAGVVNAAAEGQSARGDMRVSGRNYLLTASVVRDGGGLVLLMQDVTEQSAAEEARKRFSANVSHELRTPLTTISGYAELMQNGMTQPADVPVFARKIYEESRRMLQLIEDIMRLSRLDEGYTTGRRQRVTLLKAAARAAEENEELARENNVRVTVQGDEAEIVGDPALLDEMLRNLVENGIKYNRPDGQVTVRVTDEGETARLTVEDTGIGIPPEHTGRVFERFYRVDKSRSKQTGGTGLGLSIVKHGAEVCHADVTLESQPGVGTIVTLVFPKEKR